jgi:hypothetical protein
MYALTCKFCRLQYINIETNLGYQIENKSNLVLRCEQN